MAKKKKIQSASSSSEEAAVEGQHNGSSSCSSSSNNNNNTTIKRKHPKKFQAMTKSDDDDFDLALLSAYQDDGKLWWKRSLRLGGDWLYGIRTMFSTKNTMTTATTTTKKKKGGGHQSSVSWKTYATPCLIAVALSIFMDQQGVGSLSRFLMLAPTRNKSRTPSTTTAATTPAASSLASTQPSASSSSVWLPSTLQNLIRLMMCENDNDDCIYTQIMDVVDRTIFAGRRLEANRKLFDVSRYDQIWTLDALRAFAQQPESYYHAVLKAKHPKTHQPLAPQAHLALYLSLLRRQQEQQRKEMTMTEASASNQTEEEQKEEENDGSTLLVPIRPLSQAQSIYLDLLPTYEDFASFHPVTMDLRTLHSLFGAHTNFYFLVAKRKTEIESEYKAFQTALRTDGNSNSRSGPTKELPISFQEYMAARLSVQTRGFKAGPLEEGMMTEELQRDIELFQSTYQVPPGQETFSTSMVPILDALNHHHREHNVQWKYVDSTQTFLAYTPKPIAVGAELYGSYGDRAELFATYGFVNGDFSERTSALMAAHQLYDTRLVPSLQYLVDQKQEIVRYLQHDDGYLQCVSEHTNPEAMEMKALKRKAILLLANVPTTWLVSFPPRDSDPNSGSVPIDDGMAQIVNTARMLALTHRDYDGAAPTILSQIVAKLETASRSSGGTAGPQQRIQDYRFALDKEEDGLEYRTMVWLWRMAQFNLDKYDGVTSHDERIKTQLLEPRTKEWHAAYVRHQELIALETIKAYAEQSMPQYGATVTKNPDLKEDFFFRAELCPIDTHGLQKLFSE